MLSPHSKKNINVDAFVIRKIFFQNKKKTKLYTPLNGRSLKINYKYNYAGYMKDVGDVKFWNELFLWESVYGFNSKDKVIFLH